VRKYDTRLEAATSTSLEALNAYSLGVKTYYAKGYTAGLPFFQRAADLDPSFAMAYARIGQGYFDLNQGGRAAEYLRRAYDLREKVSERERFFIEGTYYFFGTGELEKAASLPKAHEEQRERTRTQAGGLQSVWVVSGGPPRPPCPISCPRREQALGPKRRERKR
jgi:tetratricopeptide (TPR) repeat protein